LEGNEQDRTISSLSAPHSSSERGESNSAAITSQPEKQHVKKLKKIFQNVSY
jgi:hypothetical protein